ncbi:MAG: AI-2E family transporter [bacterium]|nr:AI-2E family transporter [bacterium]
MSLPPVTKISISTGTLFRAMFVFLFFVLLFYLRSVLMVLLTAVVIASSIEPLTLWLKRFKIPRIIAVIGTYIVLAVAFVGIFYFFVPSLLSDTANFLRAVPAALDAVASPVTVKPDSVMQSADLVQTISQGITSATDVSSLTAVFTDLSQILGSFAKGFWDNVSIVFGGIIQFVLIVVLSFYLAVQEDGVGAFLRVVTPEQHESYVTGLWKRSQKKIGFWIQGQILLAVLVGVLVYLGLTVVGVKNALFLAALAAILETIPLFGPLISAIPGIAIAYGTGSISFALLVAGVYLIIQQFENHLIYPLVVKKIIGVPPMIVILALIVGLQLGGFLGLVLSVPLAATLMEYLDDVQRRKKAATVQ